MTRKTLDSEIISTTEQTVMSRELSATWYFTERVAEPVSKEDVEGCSR